jgi:hypothetical protein
LPTLTGLTNRDIALLVWLGVVAIFLVWKRDTRESLIGVARAFWGKVAVLFLAYAVYVTLVVAIAYAVGAWNTGILKETVAWFLVPGVVLLFGFSKAYEERAFYFRTLLRVIGLTALIEFYVSLASFPLWVELLLLPLTVLLVALSTVAGIKPETEVVKRWVDRVISLGGLIVLVATAVYLANDWANLDKAEMALSFAQPIWLTIASLPYIFVFSLLANYEEQFVRIGFFSKDDPKARRRAKLALVRSFHVRNRELRRFPGQGQIEVARSQSWSEARRIIAYHRAVARQEEAEKEVKAAELARYAGVEGTDWEGRPLDKREFEETKEALDHLAAFHQGQFKNGRYRADLISVVGGIVTKAFPETEITMKVAPKGKAWYAWRRTPAGWHFGIGASGAPPDRWTYEGGEPPSSHPSAGSGWKHGDVGEETNKDED